QTIFLRQNLAMAAILIAVSVVVAYASAPDAEHARTARELGVVIEPPAIAEETAAPRTPERSSRRARSFRSRSRC
ncbi:MAG: Short chain fatty acid transporter, partial [Acidobacteria bacterium]|nr:Short chain fatty acid transporter [Acidobacteriota bacterium]